MQILRNIFPFPVLALTFISFFSTASPASALKQLQTFRDWSVYKHDEANNKMCFAITKPKDMEPKNVSRGSVFFYVTTWPEDKVKQEVSVKIGYPLKAGSQPTAAIGGSVFSMFAKGDKAFVADEAMEDKMIAAMRAGKTMVVKGVSHRGTKTTDKYSLSGISAALNHLRKICK